MFYFLWECPFRSDPFLLPTGVMGFPFPKTKNPVPIKAQGPIVIVIPAFEHIFIAEQVTEVNHRLNEKQYIT